MSQNLAFLKPYTPTSKGWTATVVNSIVFQKLKELPLGHVYDIFEDSFTTPELVSYEVLKNLDYAWIIMAYNNFLDIREIYYDNDITKVKVPKSSALLSLFTKMQEKQND